MKFSVMALVAGAALLCASPAQAQKQDEWTAQVSMQLDAVVEALEAEGLTPALDPAGGSLNEGESEELELELTEGSYLIIGVCDADCTDLDLQLSAGREEIARDFSTEDPPILEVVIEEGGLLNLRVDMATCGSEPCRYGIGVFTVSED